MRRSALLLTSLVLGTSNLRAQAAPAASVRRIAPDTF